MCAEKTSKPTAAEVLRKYSDEHLPEFLGRPVQDVNQVGMTGDRPIHVACIRGNVEDLTALISGGADVSAPGDLGQTPLHIAASRGLLDVAEVLLRHSADVHARNEFGQSPIDLARLMSDEQIAELLESVNKFRS
jgi:uncharacterized protein